MPRKKANPDEVNPLDTVLASDVSNLSKQDITVQLDALYGERIASNKKLAASAEVYKASKAEVEKYTAAISARLTALAG